MVCVKELLFRKPINVTIGGTQQERIVSVKKVNKNEGILLLQLENKENPFELKELALSERDFKELHRRHHTQFKKGFKDFAQHIAELVDETLKTDTRYFASIYKESESVDIFSIIEDKESTSVEYLHLTFSRGSHESIEEIVLAQLHHLEETLKLALTNVNENQISICKYKEKQATLEKRLEETETTLEKTVKEYEHKILRLKEKHKMERQDYEALHKNSLENITKDLENKLKNSEKLIDNKVELNNELQQKNASLQLELDKSTKDKEEADKDIKILRYKLNNLKERGVHEDNLKLRIHNQENILHRCQNEIVELRKDLAQSLRVGEHHQLERHHALKDLSRAKAQLYQAEGRIKYLHVKSQALEKENEKLKEALLLNKNSLLEYQAKYSDSLKDLKNKEKENRSLKFKIEKLEEKVKVLKTEREAIRAELRPCSPQLKNSSMDNYLEKKFVQ